MDNIVCLLQEIRKELESRIPEQHIVFYAGLAADHCPQMGITDHYKPLPEII
ncbi:MAG: hypothetical protein MJB12_18755 [Firmicutes bacterium]|nr:hypothetical protein [Bacillota bacterium]